MAFLFKIKPELKEEYKEEHDKIWPDMVKAIKKSGVRNYSIFFRKDGMLFAYLEVDSFKKYMEKISKTESNTKWQKRMEKYFIKESKNILGPEMEMLEEVFHLD